MGTKNGQIRNESANYTAWVKPPSQANIGNKDFIKSILVGFTKSNKVIDGVKMPRPFMIGNFSYSFNITIYDFYINYGYWRHIFHKGTPIIPGNILSYQSWENLITEYPNQSVGVWLAPFTNNLRIAITTTSLANKSYGSYPDAFVEKCDDTTKECYITDLPSGKWNDRERAGDGSNAKTKLDTYIEYFDHDIKNFPINKQINVTINIRGNNVEVYLNGKITKITQLDGVPMTDKTSLYVMNDKSFGGNISNLLYYPDSLKLNEIQKIMSITPSTE
jgi:hypothetical protein